MQINFVKDKQSAWLAVKAMLMCVGGMSTVAYIASMQWWLFTGGVLVISGSWYALYRALVEWKGMGQ